jgi:mediator of RNA polymerase II transcription subunit 16
VAWSRGGTIASISSDGINLEFRSLRSHPDNGNWGLSEKTVTDVVKGTPTNPLVHLEWSGTNTPELAVIDSVGRVTLMNFSISLNSPFVSRRWEGDNIDDVNAVVGCHWLPVAPSNQQVISSQSAE